MNMTFLCLKGFFSEAVFTDHYVCITSSHAKLYSHVVAQQLHHNSFP